MDAIGTFTFYQLLQIGQGAGLAGSEPEVVQAVLGDAALMHEYFDNFVLVLETLADRAEDERRNSIGMLRFCRVSDVPTLFEGAADGE